MNVWKWMSSNSGCSTFFFDKIFNVSDCSLTRIDFDWILVSWESSAGLRKNYGHALANSIKKEEFCAYICEINNGFVYLLNNFSIKSAS